MHLILTASRGQSENAHDHICRDLVESTHKLQIFTSRTQIYVVV
jgi:hypothetical protein